LSSCFVPETPIRTTDGEVTIARLFEQPGAAVLGADGHPRRVERWSVRRERERLVRIVTVDGRALDATVLHPLLRDGVFVPAWSLERGDRIAAAGGVATVAQAELVAYDGLVFSVELAGDAPADRLLVAGVSSRATSWPRASSSRRPSAGRRETWQAPLAERGRRGAAPVAGVWRRANEPANPRWSPTRPGSGSP
jgi:hypothetical protein